MSGHNRADPDFKDDLTREITPANLVGRYISRIVVERLFGEYDYDLGGDECPALGELIILYGENGTGKTTILRLIYHLLSYERSAGHRTAIAQTRFQAIALHLNDGTVLSARRKRGRIIGGFEVSLAIPSGQTHDLTYTTEDARYVVRATGDEAFEKREDALLGAIADLGITLRFLGEDRKSPSQSPTLAFSDFLQETALRKHGAEDAREDLLKQATGGVLDWVRQNAVRGANIGTANANTIYANIIKELTRGRHRKHHQDDRSYNVLSALQLEQHRSEAFTKVGLTTSAGIDQLITALKDVDAETMPVVRNALRPYIDGLNARLNALQPVLDTTTALLDSFNGFYVNKRVTFNINSGIEIWSRAGELLPLTALSSGEQQLLLLFCDVITMQGSSAVVIIDEPELSLNVTWQRKLIGAFQELSRMGHTQFILATHSFEILAKYQECVLSLSDVTN